MHHYQTTRDKELPFLLLPGKTQPLSLPSARRATSRSRTRLLIGRSSLRADLVRRGGSLISLLAKSTSSQRSSSASLRRKPVNKISLIASAAIGLGSASTAR